MNSAPILKTKAALSVNEFAEYIGLSRSTMFRMIRAGRVRPVRIGRRTLIPITEAARLLGPVAA